ncbi:MAG: cyclic nucleotide-binding domain-containing protein [Anaerolineae bacterium]|nr:cyclic nucleotide-binding domain-containing protein [Anaerolineae bacterium]
MMAQKVTDAELQRIRTTEPSDGGVVDMAAANSLVRILTSLDRRLLQELITEQRFGPGDIIFCEGDDGDALYIVWAGRVAVVKGKFSQPDYVFFRLPGEVVGDMALLENKPRWASLIALEPTRLLRIERAGFYQLLQAQPAISLNLLALLSARLRAMHETGRPEIATNRGDLRQLSSLLDENEQLVALNQLRQETSDLIVHDLRSPLGNMYSVLNMLELVLPEGVLAANRELLDIARLAHARMQDLVDSLLDVSRLESGVLELDYEPVCIRQLIDDVIAMARLGLNWRAIQFQATFADDLPLVMADVERLRRVLTNLIDNAIKFTPDNGRIQVDVTLAGPMMEVSVQDSGPGIPPADRQRIFDRFARVQRTGMRRPRGYGLGLAFCRLTVEAHRGQIWVESGEGGVGSRFVFTLPLNNIQ